MEHRTGLAEFLDTLYKDYALDKKDFEKKCRENLNSLKGIDNSKWKVDEGEGWRSRTYYKFIKIKILAAFAILTDFLLQGGKIPFNLLPSPYQPEEERQDEGSFNEKSDKMKDKIEEQLEDRKADRHMLKKIFSMATYGMAWSKYNVEEIDREYFEKTRPEGYEQYPEDLEQYTSYEHVQEKNAVPGHEYRSVWSILWDFEEEDPKKMQGIFEHDMISPYELRLKAENSDQGYIREAIMRVLRENKEKQSSDANSESMPPGREAAKNRRKTIFWREYWGRAPRRVVSEFKRASRGANFNDPANILDQWFSSADDPENRMGDDVEIYAEMAAEEVIRMEELPDANQRPYKRAVWEMDLDESTGTGIADNMEDLAGAINGAIRAFEDNKKLSANVMLALKRRYLVPGQIDSFKPGMHIDINDQVDDARKAIQQITIQDVGDSLLSVINTMLQFGDDASQIPSILHTFNQGLRGREPDTAFQSNQLQENAGKYLGQVIRNIDEGFIEQEIRDIYNYNMMDPECPNDIKCLCKVHATGFTSFENKVIRAGKLLELLGLVLSDKEGELRKKVKLDKILEEIFKAKDIDPDDFFYTEEELMMQQEQEQDQQQQQIEAEQQIKEQELEAELAKEEQKSAARSQEKEEDFHRDIIKEAMGNLKAVK